MQNLFQFCSPRIPRPLLIQVDSATATSSHGHWLRDSLYVSLNHPSHTYPRPLSDYRITLCHTLYSPIHKPSEMPTLHLHSSHNFILTLTLFSPHLPENSHHALITYPILGADSSTAISSGRPRQTQCSVIEVSVCECVRQAKSVEIIRFSKHLS